MSFSKLGLTTSFAFGIALGNPYKTGVQTDCTEIITVTDVDFNQQVPCSTFNFPCDDLVGDYYFTGYDSQGTPTYTMPETGAFFSVQIDQYNQQLGILASLGFTYDGSYFAPGWDHFADVKFIDQCTNIDIFEVQSGALEGATNIQYFPKINAPYPPLYITAFLNDCRGCGFDNQEPTPKPTNQPSDPTPAPTLPTLLPTEEPTEPTLVPTRYPSRSPVIGVDCPEYDYTKYPNCDNDVNCANCQPWGCAQCQPGYYKMHNEMRCQSCTENYPGCSSCDDWNGCTTCTTGYQLEYSNVCTDEICEEI